MQYITSYCTSGCSIFTS